MNGAVKMTISADPSEIDSLYDWLLLDRELARVAEFAPAASRDSSAMSSTLEVINAVLTHVEAAASLLLAFASWRHTRSSPGPITLTRPDGKTLTIAGDPEVTSELIILFLAGGVQKPVGSADPAPPEK